jgi:integrase
MGRRRFQNPKLRQTTGEAPRWYCRYYEYTRGLDGTEKRRDVWHYYGSVASMKPTAAKKAHMAFVEQINSRASDPVSHATVGQWIDEFWALHKDTLKRTSQVLYEVQIRKHIRPFFADVKFADLDRMTVQRWMNDRIRAGLAYNTRRQLAGVLRAIITTAEDAGLYEGPNLFRRLNYGVERPVHELRLLTWPEFQRVLGCLDDSTRPMARLAALTGMRFCELAGLEWKHLDFRAELILVRQRKLRDDIDVPKSRQSIRDVPMGGLRPMLEALPRTGRFVFPEPERFYKGALKGAAIAAACDWKGFGWHDLRRLYASEMARHGANLVDLSRSLGHASIDQTAAYIRGVGDITASRAAIESEVIQ